MSLQRDAKHLSQAAVGSVAMIFGLRITPSELNLGPTSQGFDAVTLTSIGFDTWGIDMSQTVIENGQRRASCPEFLPSTLMT